MHFICQKLQEMKKLYFRIFFDYTVQAYLLEANGIYLENRCSFHILLAQFKMLDIFNLKYFP